jgi:HAD superfamily hydrolase (TIGR01662 family)
VLFDRDGTLVHDVPYNTDPDRVRPVPQAAAALWRLRTVGVRVGIVTNQSGLARGLISPDQLTAVNTRLEALLGPFDVVEVCPHGPDDGCGCRKPAPGMIKHACRELDIEPSRCVVVGDIGADMEAAESAGAAGILVPTAATRAEEVAACDQVSADLLSAVDEILAGTW